MVLFGSVSAQYKTDNIFRMYSGTYVLNEVTGLETNKKSYSLLMRSTKYTHIIEHFYAIEASTLDDIKKTLDEWSDIIETNEEGVFFEKEQIDLYTVKMSGFKGVRVSHKSRDDLYCEIGVKQISKMKGKIDKYVNK